MKRTVGVVAGVVAKLVLVALAFGAMSAGAFAQSAAPDNDTPAKFDAPMGDFDYVKRVEMIPMRDGVKLYTVITIPKGASHAPMVLTRTCYNAAGRAQRNYSPKMLDTLPLSDEIFVNAGYIRVYQDVRGKYGSEGAYLMTPPPIGPLNSSGIDDTSDAYEHDRLAGEERAGIERQSGNDRIVVRRIHGGDGADSSASGVEKRRCRKAR